MFSVSQCTEAWTHSAEVICLTLPLPRPSLLSLTLPPLPPCPCKAVVALCLSR